VDIDSALSKTQYIKRFPKHVHVKVDGLLWLQLPKDKSAKTLCWKRLL